MRLSEWIGRVGEAARYGWLSAAAGARARARLLRWTPIANGRLALSGLDGEVAIYRDRWGVPHVYASSDADLFYAQGFVQAQDRLWQMELSRRISQGQLAEAFGPDLLDADRFFRRLGLHRTAAADVANAPPELANALRAYTLGVNGYLAYADGRYPLEFLVTRLEPRAWTPLDSLSFGRYMAWILSENWLAELMRSRLIDRVGPELTSELEPTVWRPDDGAIPEEVLRGDRSGERATGQGERATGRRGDGATREGDVHLAACLSGWLTTQGASNAWAVSGARTSTGRPILANDPHLLPVVPPPWYEVHLNGGSYHVAGASQPGLPGVMLGHNERIAWGITAGMLDLQDLFEEQLDGARRRYRHKGEWRDAEMVQERIVVRGSSRPVIEEVVVTHHGPILTPSPLIPEERRALALCSVPLRCGESGSALLAVNRAGSWSSFREALAGWRAPPLNFVYADVDGNIGYQKAAQVPVRKKGVGLVPSPGWVDDYEWEGWVPFQQLPSAFNPERGYTATANNRPVETGYSHHLSREWVGSFRYRRIADALAASEHLSMRDMAALQRDVVSLAGREVADYLRHLMEGAPEVSRDPDPAWAMEQLAAWDGSLAASSVPAAVYEVFKLTLLARRYGPELGDDLLVLRGRGPHPVFLPVTNYAGRISSTLIALLRERGEDPELRAQVQEALGDAVRWLRARLGRERRSWRWGRLHRLTLRHALGRRKPLNLVFNLGPYEVGGDGDTPFQTTSLPPGLAADGLTPSCRMICDLSDWDSSVFALPAGQSGHRFSPNYSDQTDDWLDGRYHPMPFSADAVRRHATGLLELVPRA